MSHVENGMSQNKKNKMGVWMLTALVTGNMIGSGVFLLPANLAKIGTISLISWTITALGAFLLAILFSQLSSLVPKAGGPYAYAREGFGNFIGFQTAYCYWATVWIGNAAISLAATGYLSVFFPILRNPIISTGATIILVWIFTLINIRGARAVGSVQLITTIVKIIPLLFIAIGGWWYFHPNYITQNFNVTTQSNFSALSHGAALTLWSFIGVESAVVGSDAVANPKRTIPIATLLGTLIAAAVYISSSLVIMGMVPIKELSLSSSPFALAAKQMLGEWGSAIIAATAVISCLGALNGWLLLQGQVALAAAEDHLFPKFFAKRNVHDIPAKGVLFTSVLVSLLLLLTISPNLVNQFHTIILLAVITALIPYFYSAIASIIIVHRQQLKARAMALGLLVAILTAIYSFWAILSSGVETVFYGSILILTSFPLYAWLKWRQKKQANSVAADGV